MNDPAGGDPPKTGSGPAPPSTDEVTHVIAAKSQLTVGDVAERLILPLLFLGIIAFFSLLPATTHAFSTGANIRTVLSNQAIVAVAALAVIPSIAAGQYDLSIGANVGASAMAAAGAARAGWSVPAVLAIALTVGLCIGAVNGLLVAYLRIDSLIATIGTATIIGALVSWYSDSSTIIAPFPESFVNAINDNAFGIPRVVVIVAVIGVAIYFLMDHTPLGRYFQGLGANWGAARLVGLNVSRLTVGSLALTGVIGAIAGILIATQNGSVSPQTGPEYTLVALSAVFLGSTAIQPGRFNALGTLIAVYFVAFIVNGLTLAGAADWVNPLFNGLALLVAVALSIAVRRRGAS
jgi:ribose transport system permease protein